MNTRIRSIGVLTSGGDAPGMNAAIRAVTRSALYKGWDVYGIYDGYEGLITNNIRPLTVRDVGGIIQQGGTMLGSARCPEFKEEEGRKKGVRYLNQHGIDALVVIGGNGSQTGSHALHQMGVPVVGVASTIDNDLYGSDITIGVDTALNVALTCIDMLKVTASSHERAFLVEVMGRNSGYLALMAGIAGGAEAVCIPEVPFDPEDLAKEIEKAYERGKRHALIVVAEGANYNATALIEYFKKHEARLGFELRATILGHLQRGGTPGAFDRTLATRLGAAAVEQIAQGNFGLLVGHIKGETATTPLDEVVGKKKPIDMGLVELAQVLAV
ncbi:MAG: 6-phosphofructokinase [Anaerolineae bacterium]